MPKLPPSGYMTAEETKKPGYLAKRMVIYRKKVEEEAKQRQQNVTELKPRIKVKP